MTGSDPRTADRAEAELAAEIPAPQAFRSVLGQSPAQETPGCPSPVPWREIVQAFRAESRPWRLDRGRYELEGWTWGTGPPVYFLHGLSATSELFALCVWLLKEQFRCVLLNLPGSRRGTVVRGRLTLQELVADLFSAADLHEDRKFQIFASSFGCLVALEALRSDPDRVERAVLQGGFAHLKLSIVERLLVRLGCVMPGQLNILAFRRTIQAYNHRRWFPPFDADRWQFFIDTTGRVPIASIAQRAAIIRDYDGRDALAKICQPVLLIRSEGEGLVSSYCHKELTAGLPHARIEWLHSCGHLPYLTHPHRLANIIRPFLSGADEALPSPVVDASPAVHASPMSSADRAGAGPGESSAARNHEPETGR